MAALLALFGALSISSATVQDDWSDVDCANAGSTLEQNVCAGRDVRALEENLRLYTDTAYAVLRERCGLQLSWADQSIEAVTSSAEEAAAFGFDSPAPCLRLKRLSHTADGKAVEYAEGTFRGDAYRYRLRLA